jgi:hypothetical protein
MWCPSVSLSVWSNAWLAGHAAPDDVLDALSAWAPCHSVIAYDAVAAGRTGLPWPDVDAAGTMSLLQTVRTVAGRRGGDPWPTRPTVAPALPVPGDVRGLAAGTQFQSDALEAGETVLLSGSNGAGVGLVPTFEWDDCDDEQTAQPPVLSWSVYSVPDVPVIDHPDLGDAEYALRAAVRSAAEALDGLRLCPGGEDPRALVENTLDANSHHRIPDHAPNRAVRVLATAAHVDAMRPLTAVVRSARLAAVTAILHSAWS